jgi:phage FluMu protein Com
MKLTYVLRWKCAFCGKVYRFQAMVGGCPSCKGIQFTTKFVWRPKIIRITKKFTERCLSGLKELFAKQSV